MTYKELNYKNRVLFDRNVQSPHEKMSWEDGSFMDYLCESYPHVRATEFDEGVSEELSSLRQLLEKFSFYQCEEKAFLNRIRDCINSIREKEIRWHGITFEEIESFLKAHRSCLIYGEGGIGKSFFIRELEDRLSKQGVEHLCIYGKYEKDASRIDCASIEAVLKTEEFILVVDALNEMEISGQQDVLNLIKQLSVHNGFRTILSFRTHTLNHKIKQNVMSLFEYPYRFRGVSYDSALSYIQSLGIKDVDLYHDIIGLNNPLIISKAVDGIKSLTRKEGKVKGITSITTIYEAYVKNSIGKSGWDNVKRLASLMYDKSKKSITYNEAKDVVNDLDEFINKSQQHGVIGQYVSNGERTIFFSDDAISDFLIARRLMDDLDRDNLDKSIVLLNEKLEGLYGIGEAIIVALFDKFGDDYKSIFFIIKESTVLESLDADGVLSALLKVRYKPDRAHEVHEFLKNIDLEDAFLFFAGNANKPFNCKLYINDYIIADISRAMLELNRILSNSFFVDRIIGRLKNAVYCVSLDAYNDEILEEFLYFAVWCSVSSHQTVRTLAIKLLYDVLYKRHDYCDVLKSYYTLIDDDYMREAIVSVLCFYLEENEVFLKSLIEDEEYVYANSLARIAMSFEIPHEYINWHKKNYYRRNEDATISEDMHDLLTQIDLSEKGFVGFRYWDPGRIDECEVFIDVEKEIISRKNDFLARKYACAKEGECAGLLSFEINIRKEVEYDSIRKYHITSFLKAYENILSETCARFNISLKPAEKDEPNFYYPFKNTMMRKCIDIARNTIYGSMMCNYYTTDFATFNNAQNSIGFEVYSPIKYGEKINISSPIALFNSDVEYLDDKIVGRIRGEVIRDTEWVRNINLSKANILKLIEPVSYKGHEWMMIAGRIRLSEYDKYDAKWIEVYNVLYCTDNNTALAPNDRNRFLTIEVDEFGGRMDRYQYELTNSHLCKSVKQICYTEDVLGETNLQLPPAQIIRDLNLKYSSKDVTWRDEKDSIVIYCNASKSSYYKDNIVGSIYMRVDVLDEYLNYNRRKHFVFTEKYTPETGYEHSTSLHFEILDGIITREFLNYYNYPQEECENKNCANCQYDFGK